MQVKIRCFSMAYCKVLSRSSYEKILTSLKNIRQTKVQKILIYGEKKEIMEQRETNSNASYYKLAVFAEELRH